MIEQEIKDSKWQKVKSAYRKYSLTKNAIKLGTPMSSDELCKVASYLNHYHTEWGIEKFNQLKIVGKNGTMIINYTTMPF